MVTRVKPILPAKMQITKIRRELVKGLRDEGKDLQKDFEQTTATWGGEKPDFKPSISLASFSASVTVEPTGSKKGVNKWNWLNAGTSKRWALMSRNWKSKTKPGRLRSGSGSGMVVIAGRQAMQARNIRPRKGIKARGWSVKIGRQNTRRFQKRMSLATRRGAKLAYA